MNQACFFWNSCCWLWLHYIRRTLYLESTAIFEEAKVVNWFRDPEVTQGKFTVVLLVIHTWQIVQCCLSADKLQDCSTVYSVVFLQTNCRTAVQWTMLFVCRQTARLQYSVQCCLSADKLQSCNSVQCCLQTQLQNSTGRSCHKHIARLYKRSNVLLFEAVSFGK
jgi:hypothetical protein